MTLLSKLFASTGLALLLASCGSGVDEAPAADTTAGEEMAMNDPTNPFAQSETAMNERMMAAFGSDVSDTWVKQMIEHHRGAIAMSEIVLTQSPTPEVLAMAKDTIAKQGKEIEDLTKLLSKAPGDAASLEPYKPANMVMHEAMMAAKGADVSETYLRKMLEHHRGAVALTDVVLAKGATGAVRTAAQKVKAVQSKEISMIERMLAGETMSMTPQAKEPPDATATKPVAKPSPASTRAASAPAAKASPKPTAKATPTATASADPHAGMKM